MRNRVFAIAIVPLSLLGLAACGGASGPSSADPMAMDATLLGTGATLAATCTGCHSDANGAIASLAAHSEAKLQNSLLRYKTEAEGTTVMHRLARGYSDEDIALVSAYLGRESAAQ